MSSEQYSPDIVQVVHAVADYDVTGIDNAQIVQITGLSLDELNELRSLELYNDRLRSLRTAEVNQQVDRARRAQGIMTQALCNIDVALKEDVTNAELALRAALAVDRLARNGALSGKGDLPNVNAPTGIVTLSLPAAMVGVIVGVTQERIDAQQVHAANKTKNVGMIGVSALREHMGIAADANVVDVDDFMEVTRL